MAAIVKPPGRDDKRRRKKHFGPRGRTRTEAEWRAGDDPAPLLAFLRDELSDRQARLLAAAGCREVWPRLVGDLVLGRA